MKHEFEVLQRLTATPGPSGHEEPIQEVFKEITNFENATQYSDALGNHYTEIPGKPGHPRIMLNAHSDTIGMMVRHIDEDGFVFTTDLGDVCMVEPTMLPGTPVTILSRHNDDTVPGVIMPNVPHHLADPVEDEGTLDCRHYMAIDIGARSFRAAQECLDIGDYVLFEHYFRKLKQLVCGTYFDNRLGLYMLYLLGKKYSSMKSLKPTIILASTVSEEISLGAVGILRETAKPDISITFDSTPATDAILHDADYEVFKRYGKFKLGDGPVLLRGMAISETVFRGMENICRDKKIGYQVETSDGGTDNQYIYTSGLKTGLILVPIRNLHTRVETFDPADVDSALKLCDHFIRNYR
jgi:endoglucanase